MCVCVWIRKSIVVVCFGMNTFSTVDGRLIMLTESVDGARADLASKAYIAASGGNCFSLSALTTHLNMLC